MRVLVTGAGGLLGSAIVVEFARDAEVIPLDRRSLDVTDPTRVAAVIERHRPDVVINCAAFNDVDRAEEEATSALATNALAVRDLARACLQAGARFVHYSSDFVFDGAIDRPYMENDRANPQSVYGASKLLGDLFALECPRAFVLRVESLFGPASAGGRRGSLGTLVDRIRAGQEVPVFIDRVVSPSFTPHIAAATRHLLVSGAPDGLYHCVNSGQATWAEIAAAIGERLELPLRSRPLTLETAGLRARRPRYCALDNGRLLSAGAVLPPWEQALGEYLEGEPAA